MTSSVPVQAGEAILRADAETLSRAQHLTLGEGRREVQLLIMRALQIDAAQLLAHPERACEAKDDALYREMLARRISGEPIAYIVGEREFYGRAFYVTPAVLIPRPETELLVECSLERLPSNREMRVLDLGTGSGCIAIVLAKLRRETKIIATDASKAALAIAARNLVRHAAYNIELRAGSWFNAVAGLRFDVIVANPPYIAEGDAHLSEGDLRFEPPEALWAGNDGLSALAWIVADAPEHLRVGGSLLVEHGYDQGETVCELMRKSGFAHTISRTDLAGIPRVAIGRVP